MDWNDLVRNVENGTSNIEDDDDWGLDSIPKAPNKVNDEFIETYSDDAEDGIDAGVDVDLDFGSSSFVKDVKKAQVTAEIAEIKKEDKKFNKIAFLWIGSVLAIIIICFLVFIPKENRSTKLDVVKEKQTQLKEIDMRTDENFKNLIKKDYANAKSDEIIQQANAVDFGFLVNDFSNYEGDIIKITGTIARVANNKSATSDTYDTIVVLDADGNQSNWFVKTGIFRQNDVVNLYGVPYHIDGAGKSKVPSLITIIAEQYVLVE